MNLQSIKQQLASITQGEWTRTIFQIEDEEIHAVYVEGTAPKIILLEGRAGTLDDFNFISAAPGLVRELVLEVERLREQLRLANVDALVLEAELNSTPPHDGQSEVRG